MGSLIQALAKGLVGCEALQGLKLTGEVVDAHQIGPMLLALFVGRVIVASHRCLLEGAIHPLSLTIGSRVSWFG